MSDTFCARRLSLRWLRWAVLVVVAGAAGIGVSGCGAEKDVSGQQRQVQVRAENLAKQRESALALIANHPDVEVIRFTQEGDRPGLGAPWSANAVVTIEGDMLVLEQALDPALAPGTLARLTEGCDHTIATCAARFGNAINFQGEPFLPGNDLLTRYPGSS